MSVAVILVGEFDLANSEKVGDVFDSLEREASVVVDLAQAAYIDSTCISRLIMMQKHRAAAELAPLTVVVPSRSVARRIFDVVRLDALFRVVESIDDAVGRNGETMTVRYLHGDDRQ